MRTLLSLIAVLTICTAAAKAEIYQHGSTAVEAYETAANIQLTGESYTEVYEGDVGCGDACDSCGECGCGAHGCKLFGRGCKLFGHGCGGVKSRKRYENLWENCNCNGSYKFPVPPLYTYHWPGLYSWQLMTDYQSPYRFPAIKPYTEENVPGEAIVPASFVSSNSQGTRRRAGSESISDKMRRIYGE